MGMCKNCGEVLNTTLLENGVCPECVINPNRDLKKEKSIVEEMIVSENAVQNNYKLSTIISVLSTILGTILVIVGVFEVVLPFIEYMNEIQKIIIMIAGVYTLIGGMTLILIGQVSKATTDNANYTKAIFELLKNR